MGCSPACALFLGVREEASIISKLSFASSVPNSAIGLSQLSFITQPSDPAADPTAVPEPTSRLALGIFATLGYQRRRSSLDDILRA